MVFTTAPAAASAASAAAPATGTRQGASPPAPDLSRSPAALLQRASVRHTEHPATRDPPHERGATARAGGGLRRRAW